jgi:hypothetical protein
MTEVPENRPVFSFLPNALRRPILAPESKFIPLEEVVEFFETDDPGVVVV